jgi:hypothetical protein
MVIDVRMNSKMVTLVRLSKTMTFRVKITIDRKQKLVQLSQQSSVWRPLACSEVFKFTENLLMWYLVSSPPRKICVFEKMSIEVCRSL